jgi:hypothetical protein
MGNLKPIGSEKLSGQDKINRIMEIARFKENTPSNVNETHRSEYSVVLADNNEYHVVKERQGYIIKRSISESEIDYIEPMKNRKYYPSYSQAFKRLNLLAGELNRLNENVDGISLFGEQKKFTLKTPKPAQPVMDTPPVPSEPPAVPSPELPMPSADTPAAPSDVEADIDLNLGDDQEPEMGTDMGADMGMDSANDGEQVTFKTVQKLTGKLTQKIRTLSDEEGMSSEDIKYVINMVLSSVDINELTDEDKEDILSKFEGGEDEMDMDIDMSGPDDITSDSEVEDVEASMDEPIESSHSKFGGSIMDSIFSESKVDKVLGKYFEKSVKEIKESEKIKAHRLMERKEIAKKSMKSVVKLCETIEQELASQKFLEKNPNYTFVGKTNKKNLVFENKSGQIKISPEGNII